MESLLDESEYSDYEEDEDDDGDEEYEDGDDEEDNEELEDEECEDEEEYTEDEEEEYSEGGNSEWCPPHIEPYRTMEQGPVVIWWSSCLRYIYDIMKIILFFVYMYVQFKYKLKCKLVVYRISCFHNQ